MIPPEAMTILATIGLTQDQAVQVSRAFNLIDEANSRESGAVAQEQRAANAARIARYRQRRVDLGLTASFIGVRFSQSLKERDGDGCVYCGGDERMAVNHMVPITQGGTDDVDNLGNACRFCNSRKAGRRPEEAGITFRSKTAEAAYARYVRGPPVHPVHVLVHPAHPVHPVPTEPRVRAFCIGEEVDINPLSSPSAQTSPKGDVRRGTRLPEDWSPSGAHLTKASELGLLPSDLETLAEEFRNYWLALPGAKARKLDWHRTFINRLTDQAPRYLKQRQGNGYGQRNGSLVEAGYRAIRRETEREAAVREEASPGLRDDVIRLLSQG